MTVPPARRPQPVRIVLIGYGWFADLLQERVSASVPDLVVVGAVDPDPERRIAAEARGLVAAAHLDDLVRRTDLEIDAVAVLTPHDTHLELVTAAARQGLHVFCEKAFAVNSLDCIAMIRACSEAGVVLFVGHMQKLFEPHRRAIEIARSGELGEVRSVSVRGTHWCPVFPGWWRSTERCGGLLYWTGIHDLDTVRAIVGSEAATAYAVAPPRWDDYTDYEDAITAVVTYESGAVASLHVAEQWPIEPFEESFEIDVVLTGGGLRVVPSRATIVSAKRSGREHEPMTAAGVGSFQEMEDRAYRQELADFVRAIRSETEVHPSAVDGLRCVETLEAIYRSLRSGQPEVVARHPLP